MDAESEKRDKRDYRFYYYEDLTSLEIPTKFEDNVMVIEPHNDKDERDNQHVNEVVSAQNDSQKCEVMEEKDEKNMEMDLGLQDSWESNEHGGRESVRVIKNESESNWNQVTYSEHCETMESSVKNELGAESFGDDLRDITDAESFRRDDSNEPNYLMAAESSNAAKVKYRGSKKACPRCKVTFRLQNDLMEHCEIFSGDDLLDCSYCEGSFDSNCSLMVHVNSVHGGKKAHRCGICTVVFFSLAQLRSHVQTHLSCPKCKVKFNDIRNLIDHVKKQHMKPKYNCECCGAKCKDLSQLMKHVNTNHHVDLIINHCVPEK